MEKKLTTGAESPVGKMIQKTLSAAFAVLLSALLLSSCGTRSGRQGETTLSDTIGKAVIAFDTLAHDFGDVREGERVAYIFTFTNSGDADLVVASATASCGCTVSKFSSKPVQPGGKGQIEVTFDTEGREGVQTKTVVVQSNAENKVAVLRIIARVKP